MFLRFPLIHHIHTRFSSMSLSNISINDLSLSTKRPIYHYVITVSLNSRIQFLNRSFFYALLLTWDILSSFFFLCPEMSDSANNGEEVTSLIHRSSDKLSSILGARRPPPFLPDNLLPRLSPVSPPLTPLAPFHHLYTDGTSESSH